MLEQLEKHKGSQSNKTCHFERNLHSLGYSGRHCEADINECYSDPCHYGTCIDGLASFSCQCKPGYTGRLCETNINECLSQPCRNGGTCQDRENAYICSCPKGTTGNKKVSCAIMTSWLVNILLREIFSLSGINCEINIDDCKSNPCDYGTCIDKINGYECACEPGYTGKQLGFYIVLYSPSQYNVMHV